MRVKESRDTLRSKIREIFGVPKDGSPLQVISAVLNQDVERFRGKREWEASPLISAGVEAPEVLARRQRLADLEGAEGAFSLDVRNELRADVLSIVESKEPATTGASLRSVVSKIEKMNLTSFLGVWRWESKTRDFLSNFPMQGFCILGDPFKVNGTRFFTFETPGDKSVREFFYWLLYQTLKSGEFSRLRKCPNCSNFYIAKDLKRKFCSAKCKDDYYNETRKKDGYFTKAWRRRRRKALNKAKRLLKEKGSAQVARVAKETGLTVRILKREGLI